MSLHSPERQSSCQMTSRWRRRAVKACRRGVSSRFSADSSSSSCRGASVRRTCPLSAARGWSPARGTRFQCILLRGHLWMQDEIKISYLNNLTVFFKLWVATPRGVAFSRGYHLCDSFDLANDHGRR